MDTSDIAAFGTIDARAAGAGSGHRATRFPMQHQQHLGMPPPFQTAHASHHSFGNPAIPTSSALMSHAANFSQPRTESPFDGRSSRSPNLSGSQGAPYGGNHTYRDYQQDRNGGLMPYATHASSGTSANANRVGDVKQPSAASLTGSSGGHAPLRRGQACQACRRRKLKCDAVRPVCGTCDKSRKAAAIANHASPVPDGDCVYDDVPAASHGASNLQSSASPPGTYTSPGATALGHEETPAIPAPKRQKTTSFENAEHKANAALLARARVSSFGSERGQERVKLPKRDETSEQKADRLESRVRELEERLRLVSGADGIVDGRPRWELGVSFTPWRHRSRANSNDPEGLEQRQAVPILSLLSPLSGRQERHRMQYSQRPSGNFNNVGSSPGSENSSRSFGLSSPVRMPMMDPVVVANGTAQQSTLPDVSTSNGNYPITDETLMQLLWPGWSSDLPSSDKVKSLCDMFFRLHPLRNLIYRPSFMAGLLLPPRHPHRPDDSLIHAVLAAAANISPYHETADVIGVRDKFVSMMSDPFSRPNTQQAQAADVLTFKEFHLSKSRLKVERSLLTDFKNPLDWLSATVICIYVLWYDGRFVESYFLNGFLCRTVAPAGLDKLPSRHSEPDGKVKVAPGIFGTPQGIEEHERRMVLWHVFIADQYTSGPPTFYENLLNEAAIQTNLPCAEIDFVNGNDVPPNTQTLSSPDLFTAGHLDDFTLHIKSAILLRRASTLTCRAQRAKASGLSVLDKHIDEFIGTFPPLSFAQASSDALNASTNISLALIYLHEPYLTSKSLCSLRDEDADFVPAPASANGRITIAVSRILETIYQLLNSSFDFALLHPQMFLSWSVAARMLGKDMIALQRRIQYRTLAKSNGFKSEKGRTDARESLPLLAGNEHYALARVFEGLDVIIEALKRGGLKCIKARRASELVGAVRSGNLKESYLAHLLYLDGVIPTGDDEQNNHGPSTSSTSALTTLSQPFQAGSSAAAHDVLSSLAFDDSLGDVESFFASDAVSQPGATVQMQSSYPQHFMEQQQQQQHAIPQSPVNFLRQASVGVGGAHLTSTATEPLAQFGLYTTQGAGGESHGNL